jgi:diacylglycerol kinase (ATP)
MTTQWHDKVKNQSFTARLGFALDGLKTAIKQEHSLRFQLGFAVALVPVLVVLRPGMIWWALCGVMVTLVLAAELFNTALENLADQLHPERHPRIKLVKDCAAAAVLILSAGAAWVGVLMILSVVAD